MKKYILILFSVLWISCTVSHEKEELVPALKTIDLTAPHDSVCLLSALVDTVIYTKLDLPDSCTIASPLLRLVSLKKWIAVSCRIGPPLLCYIFNKSDGSLHGQLPCEKKIVYSDRIMITSISMCNPLQTDESGRYFYCDAAIKKNNEQAYTFYYQKWDMESMQPVDSVRYDGRSDFLTSYFGKDRWVRLSFNDGDVVTKVIVYDWSGKALDSVPHPKRYRSHRGSHFFITSNDLTSYRKGNTFRYYNVHHTDTLFAITDGLREYPAYRFFCGDHRYPYYYRARVKANNNDGYNYYFISLPCESENYLFFTCDYQSTTYYCSYDIANERLCMSRNFPGSRSIGGLANDLDGGLPFWPELITDEDEMGRIQQVKDIRRMQALVTDEALKTRPAYRNLAAFIRDLPDETYVLATVRIVR